MESGRNSEERKISEKEERLRKLFRKVFGSSEGKEALDYIVKGICGWDVATFFTDARKQDFWMGQRSVAKRLMQLSEKEKPKTEE